MYRCQHFKIFELVPSDMYEDFQEAYLWMCFDDRILITADRLRDRYGTVIINNWYWRGEFNQSGFRPYYSDVGAELSQHKFGRALDLKFENITAEEVREEIIADPFKREFEYVTGLERNVSWLHVDCRNWKKAESGLYLFGKG